MQNSGYLRIGDSPETGARRCSHPILERKRQEREVLHEIMISYFKKASFDSSRMGFSNAIFGSGAIFRGMDFEGCN